MPGTAPARARKPAGQTNKTRISTGMHDDATLFDLGRRPTTREVADAVRTAGLGGLPSAVRRGDDVLYQEVVCRTALNRVEDMLFRWTLNPYRGCTHGCHFCFARRYQAQLELGPGDEFSSVVLVKTNFADVLADELRRPGWNPQNDAIALGTATDPYQPIEGRYRLTRRALSALIAASDSARDHHARPAGGPRYRPPRRALAADALHRNV